MNLEKLADETAERIFCLIEANARVLTKEELTREILVALQEAKDEKSMRQVRLKVESKFGRVSAVPDGKESVLSFPIDESFALGSGDWTQVVRVDSVSARNRL